MLKIHTKDGKTTPINLKSIEQARELFNKLKNPEFQKFITGMTLAQKCQSRFKCNNCNSPVLICPECGSVHNRSECGSGIQYSLPRPSDFNKIFCQAEYIEPNKEKRIHGGEKIICFCDDVQIGVMAHRDQKAIRISVSKPGIRRFSPAHKD